MTVTVTDDFTTIDAFDNATDQSADGAVFGGSGQVNTTIKVEGTAANIYQAKGTGVGTAGKFNAANNDDISSTHLLGWMRSLDNFETEANGGMRFRVTNSDFSNNSNFGEWTVGGQDTRRATQEGFIAVCVDTTRTFDFTTGTPPALTSVDGIGMGGNMASQSGQNTFFVDEIKYGSKTIIDGGTTSGAAGTSTEIGAADTTAGRGTFKNVGGVFFILSGLEFGDTGTLATFFEDSGETWLFEDQPVADTYYKVEVVANATGANRFRLGTRTGTVPDASGVGGNTWIANGAPFSFVGDDADIDVDGLGLYGCNFLNSGNVNGTFSITAANAEVISCLFSECGEITLDNSPDFLRNLVSDSTPGAAAAAVDLGTTKPTDNTFKYNTIQASASHGIRISGTSTVGDTWNFEEILLQDNVTADFLVDYPAQTGGNKVTINLLENSAANSTTQVAVTGGIALADVVVQQSVTLTVSGVTEGTPVKIIADETAGTVTKGDLIAEGFADSDGVFTGSVGYEGAWNPSGLDVLVRARNQGVAVAAIADDGGVFTDETDEAASNATGDMTIFPAVPVVNDAYYFGHSEQFSRFNLVISQSMTGTGITFFAEYWNGSSWGILTVTSDGTNGLTTPGGIVVWNLPGDWATTTVNGQGPLYYMRIRMDSFTTITQAPIGSRVQLDTTRYLPYNGNRIITASGLADTASWQPDTISKFDPND